MALAVPMARLLGPTAVTANPPTLVLLVLVTVFVPAAVLSAVPPAVVKAVLADLDQTGSVVGLYSALGTAGAIAGTFLTGFVLVPLFPTSQIFVGLAVLLVVSGLALWWWLAPTRICTFWSSRALLAGVWLGSTLADPCETETSYYCVRVEQDPDNLGGSHLVARHPATRLRGSRGSHRASIHLHTDAGGGRRCHQRRSDTRAPHRWWGVHHAPLVGSHQAGFNRSCARTRPRDRRHRRGEARIGSRLRMSRCIIGRCPARDPSSGPVECRPGDRRCLWRCRRPLAPHHCRVRRPSRRRAPAGGTYAANIIDGSEMALLRAEAATLRNGVPPGSGSLAPRALWKRGQLPRGGERCARSPPTRSSLPAPCWTSI